MKIARVLVAIACCAPICGAQIHPSPRVLEPVQNPAMVINDRGSKIEVLPNQRATVRDTKSGDRAYELSVRDATAPIGVAQLGVVFNHAMQVQGFITGEIAFKFRGNLEPGMDFEKGSFPGFAKITNPNVYVVVARTPKEFVDLVKTLQRRNDLEWVEPIVHYGQVANAAVR